MTAFAASMSEFSAGVSGILRGFAANSVEITESNVPIYAGTWNPKSRDSFLIYTVC